MDRDAAGTCADHTDAVHGPGDGSADMGAVTVVVRVPLSWVPRRGQTGKINVSREETGIYDADLDSGSCGRAWIKDTIPVGIPHGAGTDHVDTVGNTLVDVRITGGGEHIPRRIVLNEGNAPI